MSRRPPIGQASTSGFAPKVDGRQLRSARTKQRIIESFLELLREGNPNPRVDEIAKRAGCVSRSIYDHFVTVKGLHGAAAEHAMNLANALVPLAKADDDRPMRIRAQVHTRAGTCERTLHLWRLLHAGQTSSPGMRDKVTVARKLFGLGLEAIYRPELASLAATERRKLLVTLEALTDFESWGLMREYHEMSFEAACDVWIGAIDRLLPPTPVASYRPHP